MKDNKKEEKLADNLLQDINTVISEMEEAELEKEASILHDIFMKISKLSFKKDTKHIIAENLKSKDKS